MLAVSCVVGAVKAQRVQFDCETFIERILLPDMSVGGLWNIWILSHLCFTFLLSLSFPPSISLLSPFPPLSLPSSLSPSPPPTPPSLPPLFP